MEYLLGETVESMSPEPEPVSRKRTIAPERLDWVVKRCLAKDPERRWHSARDVSIELDAIAGQAAVANDSSPAAVAPASPRGHGPPSLGARVPSQRRSRWWWAAAASAVLGASVWWLASRDREPEPPAAGAENAAAGPGTAYAGAETPAALPFQTLSDDPEIRQLAGGIPQEMSTRWAKAGWTLLTPSASADGFLEGLRLAGVGEDGLVEVSAVPGER